MRIYSISILYFSNILYFFIYLPFNVTSAPTRNEVSSHPVLGLSQCSAHNQFHSLALANLAWVQYEFEVLPQLLLLLLTPSKLFPVQFCWHFSHGFGSVRQRRSFSVQVPRAESAHREQCTGEQTANDEHTVWMALATGMATNTAAFAFSYMCVSVLVCGWRRTAAT